MLTIKLDTSAAQAQFEKNMDGVRNAIMEAIAVTERKAASQIQKAVREDIAGAGNFGSKWRNVIHVQAESSSISSTITTRYSSSPLGAAAHLFDTGGAILGKPMLWLPITGGGGEHIAPRNFPGGLVSANTLSGPPLLLSAATKQPVYFGVESVTEPKLFHFEADIQGVADRIPDIFQSSLKQAMGK
jgi:hypothetical protein